jgi:plastocyanin
MRPDVRDRVVLPILLPLGIVVFLVVMLWGFSRLLLGVTATAATVTATVVAIGVLVISAVAANRQTIRSSTIGAAFGATAGLAMLAGGIALAVVGVGETEGPRENGGQGTTVELVAANIAFDPTTLTVPADAPFTIEFENRDSAQHNVQIDDPDSGTPLLEGEIITGPETISYPVEPLAPGTYPFLCVVHPQMTGEIEAVPEEPDGEPGGEPGDEPGGEPPGGEAPGGGSAEPSTVVAQGIAFDTDTITLPADQPSTLTFDNRDTVPHNIAIYRDDSLSEALFQGELVTGETVQYEVPPLPAGEYYFQCDVHPNMNGTVTVG